jgi:DNA-directed RNA polymerase subunit RPC12/RpoP
MELITGRGITKEVEAILKDRIEVECFMCLGEFDTGDYAPMMMCMNQHSCCAPCMQELLKGDAKTQVTCPHCSAPIIKKSVTKNRLLITIYELIKSYKKYVVELEDEVESLKRNSKSDMKMSLLSRNPKMVNSFISGLGDHTKLLGGSTLFDDCPTSKSHTWIGTSEKRRENILAYAEREKIE